MAAAVAAARHLKLQSSAKQSTVGWEQQQDERCCSSGVARLTARLRGAPEVIVIDNLRARLSSSALASAITGRAWEDRLLGHSTTLLLPVRCVWVATANNPALSEEMARRTVRIALDAGVARRPVVDLPKIRRVVVIQYGDDAHISLIVSIDEGRVVVNALRDHPARQGVGLVPVDGGFSTPRATHCHRGGARPAADGRDRRTVKPTD